jgi:hypothetical protein
MTDKQQEQYDRALAVVERAGLQVVGTGTTKDGRRVYAVPSRTVANLWHLVTVAYGALQCDCRAAQFNRYCCHRAAARQRIELEASRLADAREQEAERTYHTAARETDEAMSWWLRGGEWS